MKLGYQSFILKFSNRLKLFNKQPHVFFPSVGVRACPLELSPSRVVLKYGDPISINCTTPESNFLGIGWEAAEAGVSLTKASQVTWTVKSLKELENPPLCYFKYENDTSCERRPNVVLYSKSPSFLSRSLNIVTGPIP